MALKRIFAWWQVRFLYAIAAMLSPISARSSERFFRSARKRDPQARDQVSYDYSDLVEAWDSQREIDRERYEILAQELKTGPLFSVIVPVYNTDPSLLGEMIGSIRSQTYTNWELCIADDASSNPAVKDVLRQAQKDDERIKVVFRSTNGHISVATNSALELATGTFVAFVDHDGLLHRDALLHVAFELSRDRNLKVLYTDEDKIGVDSKRREPHFKPAWNRELLYGMNYICHLLVCDAELVRSIGGMRTGYEGAQDHDLLLRCVAQVSDTQICHIPKVLYHWRASPGSVAESSDNKPYATDAGLRAMADHLFAAHGRRCEVTKGMLPFTYVPQWPIDIAPKVSIIIPTRDRLDILEIAVESILAKTDYPDFEIIIVDNGSVEPQTLLWFKRICARDGRVRVIRDVRDFNYSALNNGAVNVCDGQVLAFLNNDVEVISPQWLSELASHAIRKDIGCVGAKLYYPDDTIQHAGVVLGVFGGAAHVFRHYARTHPGYSQRLLARQEYLAVTGACLAVRRSVFEAVGGFNEMDLAVAFNDIDLCLKVNSAGYRNVWTPYAELYHHESASRGSDNTPEKRDRFLRELNYLVERWNITKIEDPAYNPNLTAFHENFGFARPSWSFPSSMPRRTGRSIVCRQE